MEHAIRVQGLTKRYGDNFALDGLNLEVRSGTVLGLLGPNGAGKTTTVRVLATLLRPDAGQATVCGLDVVRRANDVRKLIGLTGQYAAVDETLTGTENLLFIGRLLGRSRAESRARARELLADFDLADAADRPAKTYSGGMRRRLDIAASLVTRPQVLFLDEPTTGLDPRARLDLWATVRGLVADGVTVLLTTQYLDEADALANEIAVVDHGRVIAHGTPDEVKATTSAQSLIVKPSLASDIPLVASLIASITGATPEVDDSTVTAPVTGSTILPSAVRQFEERGITINELSLRSATLDEVFLSLTGRSARERDAAGTAETVDSPDTTKEIAA
ncbi:ATP-binding cassette domain-containing protein [Pseudonocardia sp. TRM90224]|uniref:ATP-binding cassette domain-containing protein n=1 Tax=Pseudonocardia sp. TRM90224 TaxID=2812678 RepID=UPI001E2F490B|nr:ATP-binding cassette domain-containing protein [Pseudonocardia sp. TRM90224]